MVSLCDRTYAPREAVEAYSRLWELRNGLVYDEEDDFFDYGYERVIDLEPVRRWLLALRCYYDEMKPGELLQGRTRADIRRLVNRMSGKHWALEDFEIVETFDDAPTFGEVARAYRNVQELEGAHAETHYSSRPGEMEAYATPELTDSEIEELERWLDILVEAYRLGGLGFDPYALLRFIQRIGERDPRLARFARIAPLDGRLGL